MFGGLWDKQTNWAIVKAVMDTDIRDNILLVNHYFL